MTKNLFKYVKKFLPLIGIIILILLVISLDVEKIKNAFLSIKPIYIVLALSLTLPMVLIRNYGWQLLLKEQKIKIGYFRSLKIFLIGFFYCSITPGYIGHVVRIPYLKEETGEPYGKLFVNTVIDSVLRAISQYLMILTGAILVIGTFPELFWVNIIIFVIFVLILFYLFKKERGEKLFHIFIKYLIPRKLRDNFYRFVNTFYFDFPRVTRLILPFLLSLITCIIVFTQVYIIVIALGVDIPYHIFILLFPLANVVGFIPITLAGIGTRELTSVLIFSTLFTVTKEEVLVFTLIGFILTDIFTGFIGFLVSLTEAREKEFIPT